MKDKVFLDTNIFIYSVDSSSSRKEKTDVARQLIKKHIRSGTGVVSIQVLQEFYLVSTQKIQVPLSTEDALEYLHYMSVLETVQPDFNYVYLHRRLKLSFWDGLIVQAAAAADCSFLRIPSSRGKIPSSSSVCGHLSPPNGSSREKYRIDLVALTHPGPSKVKNRITILKSGALGIGYKKFLRAPYLGFCRGYPKFSYPVIVSR